MYNLTVQVTHLWKGCVNRRMFLGRLKYNRVGNNRQLLKEMEEADRAVWEQRQYLDTHAAVLSDDEKRRIESEIEKAEERYLLLELRRA